MKTWGALGALALLALAGCTQHTSVSGTYLARYTNGAAQMQLTESQGGQVMGSLTVITVKPDGQVEREDASITGGTVDADGKSLVITVKPNQLLAQAQNVSGQITGQGIDMQAPWGNSHFVPAKAGEFDTAVNEQVEAGKQVAQMQAQAKARQELEAEQARAQEEQERHVEELTQNLKAYNDRIQGMTQGPEVARNREEALVAKARHGLDVMHQLQVNHRDVDASQAGVAISQLSVAMSQLKIEVDQVLQQGNQHLNYFDQALAASPCFTHTEIQGCTALGTEKMRYVATRAKVESNLTALAEDFKKNGGEMDAINKQAGN